MRTLSLGASSAVGLEGSGKKDLGIWFVMCSSPALGGEEGESVYAGSQITGPSSSLREKARITGFAIKTVL